MSMQEEDSADDLVGYMMGMGDVGDSPEEKLRQVMSVIGFDEGLARFYLECSNWNVNGAVSAFFANQPEQDPPVPFQATLVEDVHIPGGNELPPLTPFSKGWKIRNTGVAPWPVGSLLGFVDGSQMSGDPILLERPIDVNEDVMVSVNMLTPEIPGPHRAVWQMMLNSGETFGDQLPVHIRVVQPRPTGFPSSFGFQAPGMDMAMAQYMGGGGDALGMEGDGDDEETDMEGPPQGMAPAPARTGGFGTAWGAPQTNPFGRGASAPFGGAAFGTGRGFGAGAGGPPAFGGGGGGAFGGAPFGGAPFGGGRGAGGASGGGGWQLSKPAPGTPGSDAMGE